MLMMPASQLLEKQPFFFWRTFQMPGERNHTDDEADKCKDGEDIVWVSHGGRRSGGAPARR